ncbi:PAS domain-containing sensor histidine kinase [Methanoculleus taiwanensis]|uniref:PAS domain-containing sensor histidine kinase n=1 Tax=Methanoculleus taiwanensis TaxID=1550565 RepID=UPI001F501569|nr:ATP-binding protein [Methanoculleus taiwanensis]
MHRRSDQKPNWDALRQRIIGLGEHSIHKSYYPELQERLAELERFRALLDQANDAIFLIDTRTGLLVDANESAWVQLGYERDDLMQIPFCSLIAPARRLRFLEILSSGKNHSRRQQMVTADLLTSGGAEVPVEITIRFVTFGEEQYAVAVAREITERKRAEEALRHHAEDLARLNRNLASAHRETNLYLDILTHDIGNTENVSNLYADLLIDSLQGKGEAARYAGKLQRSVRKSIEILRRVSKIRRIHSGTAELRPTDLNAVIREETSHFPEGIIRYRGSPYRVQVDGLLPEVFSNLIGNAIKFGGPDIAINIRTEDANGLVRVSVEDTGPGVPDDQKEAIFHRYEQEKRGVGEGLGLYLVQILVERYGGKIWVEDRVPGHPEEGAAFRFTLKKA